MKNYLLVAIYANGESDVILSALNDPAYIVGTAKVIYIRNAVKIEVWETAQDVDTFTDARTVYSRIL